MSIKALEHYLLPLKHYLTAPEVTEICINQPQEVFVEQNSRFSSHPVDKLEIGFLESLAALIAEFNYKEFPTALLSGSLPTGERIQFVMPPACEKNRFICAIRCHHRQQMTLDDYHRSGAFDDLRGFSPYINSQIDENLKALYQQKYIKEFISLAIAARKNILISGGTGTGKTTFLNACLQLIPDTERLITIEDTREVQIQQPNRVQLIFNEEEPELKALNVFKVCLRLRPDRIFLSELRGSEAWAFLRAANSGHPGSISTVHSDTPQGCFDQLVFMMQQAGSTSPEEELRKQIQSIIPIVIQLKRCPSPDRFMYVSEIYFDAIEKTKGRNT